MYQWREDHLTQLSPCGSCFTASLHFPLFLMSNGFPVVISSHMLYIYRSFFADDHLQNLFFNPQRFPLLHYENSFFHLALSIYVLCLFHHNLSLAFRAKQTVHTVIICAERWLPCFGAKQLQDFVFNITAAIRWCG